MEEGFQEMKKKTGGVSALKMREAWQKAHDELTEAYWNAESGGAKDSIQAFSGEIYEVLTELNRADFSAGSPALKRDFAKLKKSVGKIESARKEIDKAVKTVKTAAKVADALDKALDASAKFLV
jgi:DNA repair exonuclease SbcCD ATPase subunit